MRNIHICDAVMYGTLHFVKKYKGCEESDVCKIIMWCNNIALKLIAGCSAMKFTTFFTQILFMNTMGTLRIRHVINIMGYVRDIPENAYFTSWQLCIVTSTRLSFDQVILQTSDRKKMKDCRPHLLGCTP